ncbi:MAG: hypothetical protein PF505_06160 [Vallitaleaceae bacterium]|jgi:hypothetical protein|nr:hypothetical protein [Vallitaleaceae bacterium]
MGKKSTQVIQTDNIGGANFLVSIQRQDNHSWQGSIQWVDTGKKMHFRSELELLNLIHGAVTDSTDDEESFRTWEDHIEISAS